MSIGRIAHLSAACAVVASLAACGGSSGADYGGYPAAPASEPGIDSASGAAPAAKSAPPGHAQMAEADATRPGLGTEWGETRSSRISTVSFQRANAASPLAMASLFYNDDAGARAMAGPAATRTSTGLASVGGGLLEIGLKNESGGFFTGYVAGDKTHLVGNAGQRYSIVVKNKSDARFEIILSVDGLDVLDGKDASFSKRGYLVDAGGELEVEGFRQSTDAVAAFRFGSVKDSYASKKHGETRNVGVIGIAAFHERGSSPSLIPTDAVKRQQANPFPGTFATPP